MARSYWLTLRNLYRSPHQVTWVVWWFLVRDAVARDCLDRVPSTIFSWLSIRILWGMGYSLGHGVRLLVHLYFCGALEKITSIPGC